jgi:hypothetical protein
MATVVSLSHFASAALCSDEGNRGDYPRGCPEPAPPVGQAPPAPVGLPHCRLNTKRLHVTFRAVDLAMFAPLLPSSALCR